MSLLREMFVRTVSLLFVVFGSVYVWDKRNVRERKKSNVISNSQMY